MTHDELGAVDVAIAAEDQGLSALHLSAELPAQVRHGCGKRTASTAHVCFQFCTELSLILRNRACPHVAQFCDEFRLTGRCSIAGASETREHLGPTFPDKIQLRTVANSDVIAG